MGQPFAIREGRERMMLSQAISDALSKTNALSKNGGESGKAPVLASVIQDINGRNGPFFHHVGEKLNLLVTGKHGEGYVMKYGNEWLLIHIHEDLKKGEQIAFVVLSDSKKQSILKRIAQGPEKPMDETEKAQQVLRRFGVNGSRDMQAIQVQASKIPGEQTTALRYLLDPNLMAALLLPEQARQQVYQRVEVTQYQGGIQREESYEIALCLDMEHLGHLEVSLRWTGGSMFTRIWADSVETELDLTRNKEAIEALGMYLEVIPFAMGPLVERDYSVTLDMKV
jgi:flagellar hook-length control protein FliK